MTTSTLDDAVLEALGRVVDHLGRAELAQPAVVALRARRDDVRAEVGGELHREVADAAGAGVDQDALALVRLRRLDDHAPGGERGDRHRRRLDVRERARLADDAERVDREVLGVAAAGARDQRHAVDLGPRLQRVRRVRRLDDDPAEVGAEDRGEPGERRRIRPCPPGSSRRSGSRPAATTRTSTSAPIRTGRSTSASVEHLGAAGARDRHRPHGRHVASQ